MRFVLAFSSFFRLLLGAKLHRKVADYLPDDVRKELPAGKGARHSPDDSDEGARHYPEDSEKPKAPKDEPAAKTPARANKPSRSQHHRDGALAFLSLLQREGRLVDFLMESIDDYDDSDIGAAVRDIHRGCSKVLGDFLTLEAVMPGDEDDSIKVPVGFDPHEVRLVGEVEGEPPFRGVLRHHGWRVVKTALPVLSEGIDRQVIAPAEVEIGADA